MANITHYYSPETKSYEIKDFDKVKKDYEEWVKNNVHHEVVITNEEEYDGLYDERTTLRNEIDCLKGERKIINNIVIGRFDNQAKEIIDYLSDLDKKITAKLNDFKPKTPTYKVEWKTKNEKHYNKVIALINKLEKEKENA